MATSSKPNLQQVLETHAEEMHEPGRHLRRLVATPGWMKMFSLAGGGIFYDFSRQRITREILDNLYRWAREMDARNRFRLMMRGEKLNRSENRAALHTACRSFSEDPIRVDGVDIMPEIRDVRRKIQEFSEDILSERIRGATERPFRDVVVVGIGGSYLGTEFVSTALAHRAHGALEIHYLSNVDIDDFGRIAATVDLETTLWIIISKSYKTPETLCNTNQVAAVLRERNIDPSKHIVTVTSKGSPGDNPSNPVLKTFYMFDYIGGRYSVTSAVGGVPLSLFLGYENFQRFLTGAASMDDHAADAASVENLPLTAALLTYWNTRFLGYPASALIPYSAPLRRLPAHIQQLSMESNGKSTDQAGRQLDMPAGTIVFGEPGTNAQHSFFQLLHQGSPVPVEFIGVLRPAYPQYQNRTDGVTNHQELWANLLAQREAFAVGHDHAKPSRRFTGNRPSSTLVLEDLSPENVGRLLAFYEARTVYEAFLWDINPFDQFGVELGKRIAGEFRKQIAIRSSGAPIAQTTDDDGVAGYLDALIHGRLPKME